MSRTQQASPGLLLVSSHTLLLLLVLSYHHVDAAVSPQPFAQKTEDTLSKFVVLSDPHYDPSLKKTALPKYGQDSSYSLISSAFNSAAKAAPNPEFVILLGDLFPHGPRQDVATDFLHNVTDTIKYLARQAWSNSTNPLVRTPIFTLGNNDIYPSIPDAAGPLVSPQWLSRLAQAWGPPLNTSNTFKLYGYYRVDYVSPEGPTLSILSLNTFIWTLGDVDDDVDNDEDPFEQFFWLDSELENARLDSRKVWIIGHHPPGIDHFSLEPKWRPDYLQRYTDIVSPHIQNDTIAAQLFSHEHYSSMRLLKQKPGKQLAGQKEGLVLVHSSISPIFGNNPTFRVYEFSLESLLPVDFEEWNLQIRNSSEWAALFHSFKLEFGLDHFGAHDVGQWIRGEFDSFAEYANSSLGNSARSNDELCRSRRRLEDCERVVRCMSDSVFREDFRRCSGLGMLPVPAFVFASCFAGVTLVTLGCASFLCCFFFPKHRRNFAV
eukprot:TRINITY_DN17733_c0_g1_i1.p1 TRINITY_DN17733_c0_g1~~TRINITY_DN17733_c0_g1_i1.p1  ORF type:complete len:490 (-),score=90.68 TRINITY_DN17733_c0_g1_i1:51-1520(-)